MLVASGGILHLKFTRVWKELRLRGLSQRADCRIGSRKLLYYGTAPLCISAAAAFLNSFTWLRADIRLLLGEIVITSRKSQLAVRIGEPLEPEEKRRRKRGHQMC